MATKGKKRIGRKAEFKMPGLIGDPNAPTYAPSQIRVLAAVLDFTLLLGQFRLSVEGEPEMAEICRIRLSPQHAKALVALLGTKVIEYENEVGVINLPETEEADTDSEGTS